MFCLVNANIAALKCVKVIQILLFTLCDAPERALLLNMNKFNGKFGCIMCMQSGENLNKSKRGNNQKFLYHAEQIKVRTKSRYIQQVSEAISKNICFEGIKGATHLSKWLHLPTSIIIDYMHASLLGTTKHMLNIWLSASNCKKEFYLGRKITDIDEILLQVKYPIEFPREQRSLAQHLNYFKASEYRNFIFYTGIAVLIHALPLDYYVHFVEYVIFIRLLCNTKIRNEHILIAFNIIDKYVQTFQKYYGEKNMTFNLHSHLHLPQQVKR